MKLWWMVRDEEGWVKEYREIDPTKVNAGIGAGKESGLFIEVSGMNDQVILPMNDVYVQVGKMHVDKSRNPKVVSLAEGTVDSAFVKENFAMAAG